MRGGTVRKVLNLKKNEPMKDPKAFRRQEKLVNLWIKNLDVLPQMV
jgi:hypothetical protein